MSLFGPFALTSLTFVVDEVGVAALEVFGDRESPPRVVEDDKPEGEAVPEELSFFLEVLLESLARDNDSCCDQFSHAPRLSGAVSEGLSCTYHSRPETLHDE